MTALCPACETCAHCAKHGCIPVSGEAPVAAHRVVCDGRGRPIGYIAHDKDFPPSVTGKWAGRSLIDAEEAADFDPACITAVYAAPSPIPVVEAVGWQPIETAPKDGSEFLATYGRQGWVMLIVKWNALHKFWQTKGEPVAGFSSNATHWMPLPEAPK